MLDDKNRPHLTAASIDAIRRSCEFVGSNLAKNVIDMGGSPLEAREMVMEVFTRAYDQSAAHFMARKEAGNVR